MVSKAWVENLNMGMNAVLWKACNTDYYRAAVTYIWVLL